MKCGRIDAAAIGRSRVDYCSGHRDVPEAQDPSARFDMKLRTAWSMCEVRSPPGYRLLRRRSSAGTRFPTRLERLRMTVNMSRQTKGSRVQMSLMRYRSAIKKRNCVRVEVKLNTIPQTARRKLWNLSLIHI